MTDHPTERASDESNKSTAHSAPGPRPQLGSLVSRPRSRWCRHRVLEAAEHLPFPELEALWLVDVCSSDYATAAVAADITATELARRLHQARRSIRSRLEAWNC